MAGRLQRTGFRASQFTRQCKLHDTALEATLADMAKTDIRGRLARDQTFRRPEIPVGGPVSSYEHIGRESASSWRGQAAILAVDGTEAAARFQNQTLKVARYYERNR